MALLPKGVLGSKRAAIFAIIVSVVGLAIVPVLTIPAMLLAGFRWRAAPRWARVTLIVGAVIFAAYLVTLRTAPQPPRHR